MESGEAVTNRRVAPWPDDLLQAVGEGYRGPVPPRSRKAARLAGAVKAHLAGGWDPVLRRP